MRVGDMTIAGMSEDDVTMMGQAWCKEEGRPICTMHTQESQWVDLEA